MYPAERGVALVAVVAATALWTVVAVGLAASAATGTRRAAHDLAAARANALARSGIAAARAALVEATVLDVPDTLRAPWARPLEPHALGGGTVEVAVEDEARRLDVNTMPEALPALLARLRLDPLLGDAVADWIDRDDVPRPHGAESPTYRALAPPRLAANRPLGAVGDLLLVRGMDAATLARLRPFVTVAGEDGVNPNTAPPDVMLALWEDPARVGAILAERERGPVDCGDLPRCTTRSGTFTVRATGRAGDVARTVEALLRVLPGVDAEVVAWRGVQQ